ncbi:MAG: hypothetical protein RLZZ387_837 [Chloroflexota bacterium]
MRDFELHADFDRDGRLQGTPAERAARTREPGAVLVANLDRDARRLPDRVDRGPAITLDASQPIRSAGDDELLPLRVRLTSPPPWAGGQLLLRLPGIHAVRVRVFDSQGVIVPSGLGTPRERQLPPPGAPDLELRLEARTFPGSPYGHALLLDTLFQPDAEDEVGFELELLTRDAAGRDTLHDRARLSTAPVLFLDNGARVTRLYICDLPDNQPSLTDVRAALTAIGGVELVTVPADVANSDSWLQDQFQPGIVAGADGWRHAIIHLPRMRSNFVQTQGGQNLAQFVRSHFPARNVAVMNDFWDRHLVFDDAAGRRADLRLPDLLVLGNRMGRATALLRHYNRLLSRLDRTWRPNLELTWSEARVSLPGLLARLQRAIREARRGASDEWGATLEATERDATERLRHVERDAPLGADADRFQLRAGAGTIEVTGERADELFARIHQLRDSSNYGGNIEVAPPTPGAPLGTIVVGNTRIQGASDFVDPDLLRFLHKQRKQPVVQFDTTWLDVGHIDELLTFVPNRGAGQGFAALRASSGLALRILHAAAERFLAGLPIEHPMRGGFRPSGVMSRLTDDGPAPVTRMLRGKLWSHVHPRPTDAESAPDILEPPRIYQALAQALNGGDPEAPDSGMINIHDIRFWPGEGPERAYPADISVLEAIYCERDDRGVSVNDFVERTFLEPLARQVAAAFPSARLLPLPVLFDRVSDTAEWERRRWSFSTSAFTPDVVNMQVVNGRLLVPRPYGPRMRPADSTAVLTAVLRETDGLAGLARRLNPRFYSRHGLDTTTIWLRRQDAVYRTVSAIGTVRTVFGGLTTLTDVAQLFRDGFPDLTLRQVEQRIRQHNPAHFSADGRLKPGWRLLRVPEGTVDLFEAYIRLVADELGMGLHFVDSWFYHTHFGEIHCGTNVLRVPARGLPNWWDVPDAPLPGAVEMEDEVIEAGGR